MGRVQVGKHLWIRLSRRSLCDNCNVDICMLDNGERRTECEMYRPLFSAFKRCDGCGQLFDVSRNISALDYNLCPQCNDLLRLHAFSDWG